MSINAVFHTSAFYLKSLKLCQEEGQSDWNLLFNFLQDY